MTEERLISEKREKNTGKSREITWLWVLLIITIIFHAVFAAKLFTGFIPNGGDTPSHYELLQQTVEGIKGNNFWDENYFLGFPMFIYYGFFPYVLLGLLHIITTLPLMMLFKTSMFLVFILFPLAVYKGSKLLDFREEISVIAAIFSLFLTSITSFGIEYKTMFDIGLYAQWISMVFFPLAVGYAYQYLYKFNNLNNTNSSSQNKKIYLNSSLAKAVSCIFLTFSSHIVMGFIAVSTIPLMVIAGHTKNNDENNKKSNQNILKKFLIITLLIIITTSYFLVPYFAFNDYYGGFKLDNLERQNGYGFVKTISYFLTGKFFDYRTIARIPETTSGLYIPILTYLTMLGAGICIWKLTIKKKERTNENSNNNENNKNDYNNMKFLLYCLGASVIIIMGKTTFGFFEYIPFLNSLQPFRYIVLLHFTAILLIAIAIYGMIEQIKKEVITKIVITDLTAKNSEKIKPYVGIIITVLFLIPLLFSFSSAYTHSVNPDLVENTEYVSFMEKFKEKEELKGRIFVNKNKFEEFSSYYNIVPVLSQQPLTRGKGIGYHDTVSAFYLYFPIEIDTDSYFRLFGVNTIIEKTDTSYKIIKKNGKYFEFGNAVEKIQYSRNINLIWLWSKLAEENRYIINVMDGKEGLSVEDNNDFITKIKKELGEEVVKKDENKYPYIINRNKTNVRADEFFAELETTAREANESDEIKKSCGDVRSEQFKNGKYFASTAVTTTEKCLLVLKISYHPQWKAFVDNKREEILHISPNFIGVYVPSGNHDIKFQYYVWKPIWILLIVSIIVMICLFWFGKYI